MKIPNCFCCDKEFWNISTSVETDAGPGYRERDDVNLPSGGTPFMTHAFYPNDPSVRLEINVCSECLTERQDRVLHVTKVPQRLANPLIFEKWNRFKHG